MYKNIKNVCLNPVAVPRVTGISIPIFRCGKCVNCLKQKANELAVRARREFFGQNIAFLTFTYDNENCPIQLSHYDISLDTGEILKSSTSIVRDSSFFQTAEFTVERNRKSFSRRYKPLIYENKIELLNYCELDIYYPTVYYYDVKCLLKRFREKFPERLKHFICVPEYGGLGYRPHYHMLVYGLKNEELEYLSNDWKLGSVDIRFPDSSNSQECEKISMYISKYCTKGSFDCPYIKDGYCQKPRRAISQNFGFGSPESFKNLQSSLLCTHELGICDPWFNDDCPPNLNEYALNLLSQRRSYDINGFHYPFPKYLLNKILKKSVRVIDPKYLRYICNTNHDKYYKLLNEYGEKFIIPDSHKDVNLPKAYRIVSSPLSIQVTNYLLGILIRDSIREQRQSYRYVKDSAVFTKKYETESMSIEAKRETAERQFISDIYNNSIY